MSNQPADSSKPSLSYRQAGVDIDAGNRLVEAIKPLAKRTKRPGVVEGLGGFGALFELPLERYKHPVLVSGTDGVGTKLKLAMELGHHDTVGIDLVAMCANDIVVQGAEPLFFLDYYATGKLDTETATAVISGIAEGCVQGGMALIGGETAEMPGMYQGEEYDLAGFCVGIAEKEHIISGQRVQEGDVLLGLASTGPHSNGYSLIRKIIATGQHDINTPFGDKTLGETLLTPTRIYVKNVLKILAHHPVHAIAHITGGGLPENLPRVLPKGLDARIDTQAWPMPEIFSWLQEAGNVAPEEMLRTFNCGIGMVLVVPADQHETIAAELKALGETVWTIGEIAPI